MNRIYHYPLTRSRLSFSTPSVPSTLKDGVSNLPIEGQRKAGPPLVEEDGILGGEVGALGISSPPSYDDAR